MDLENARAQQSPGLLSGDLKGSYVPKSRLKSASSVRSKSVNKEGGGGRRFKRFNEEASDASVRRTNAGYPRKPQHVSAKVQEAIGPSAAVHQPLPAYQHVRAAKRADDLQSNQSRRGARNAAGSRSNKQRLI